MSIATTPQLARWYTPSYIPPEAKWDYFGDFYIPYLEYGNSKIPIRLDLYQDGPYHLPHPNEIPDLDLFYQSMKGNSFYERNIRYNDIIFPYGENIILSYSRNGPNSIYGVTQKQTRTVQELLDILLEAAYVRYIPYILIDLGNNMGYLIRPVSHDRFLISLNMDRSRSDIGYKHSLDQTKEFISDLRGIQKISHGGRVYYACYPEMELGCLYP